MRKLLLTIAILLLPAMLAAQSHGGGGNTFTLTKAGAFSGSCAFNYRGIDTTTGDLYTCGTGNVWRLAASAAFVCDASGNCTVNNLTVTGTATIDTAITVGVGLPGDSTVGAIGSTVQVDGTNHRFTQCGATPTVFCMVVSNVVTNTGQCGSTTNQPVCVWTTMDQVAGVFDNSPTAGNLIGLSAAGELHDLGTATLTGVTSGQVKGVTFGAASGSGPYTATVLVYPGYVAGGSGSGAWSAITNPSGNLALTMSTNTSTFNYGSALADAFQWANTTTASNVTTNASPLATFAANYWTGAASAADKWTIGTSLAAGTNGASTLSITHSGSTGTPIVLFGPTSSSTVQLQGISAIVGANGSSKQLLLQAGGTSGSILLATSAGAQILGCYQQSSGKNFCSFGSTTTFSASQVTLTSGFGTSPTLSTNSGTSAFAITIGSSPGSAGVITFPVTATNGWRLTCDDITTPTGPVKQTAYTTTTATITQYNWSGTPTAWTASDVLTCSAWGF